MRPILCALVFVCLGVVPATAQTSIGFENPDDLADLLAYRLPDWGWRTWNVDGELDGGGIHYSGYNPSGYGTSDRSTHVFALATDFRLDRESENLELTTWVIGAGQWSHSRSGSGSATRRSSLLGGEYDVYGRGRLHLAGSAWFLTAAARSLGTWEEVRHQISDELEDVEHVDVRRNGSSSASLGFGVGRLRDVTPLVRALRLSERLTVLGRPRLSSVQVQQVARVLAKEYGYRRVFQRPERRFWRDILDPILSGDPLSVAEIFYLTDVLREDLSGRRQGARIGVEGTWYVGGSGDDAVYENIYRFIAEASRNLSLDHQLSGYATAGWRTINGPRSDAHRWSIRAGVQHLWNLADRLRLESNLFGTINQDEWMDTDSSYQAYDVVADVALNIMVEDRFILRPYVGGSWAEENAERERENGFRIWRWRYGVTVNYRLDYVLF